MTNNQRESMNLDELINYLLDLRYDDKRDCRVEVKMLTVTSGGPTRHSIVGVLDYTDENLVLLTSSEVAK